MSGLLPLFQVQFVATVPPLGLATYTIGKTGVGTNPKNVLASSTFVNSIRTQQLIK